jgi:hypothetical protein
MQTRKNKPIRLYILKNGLGNKLFEIVNVLYLYKQFTIYFVEQLSPHQLVRSEQKLRYVFPKFESIPHCKFITWEQYDILKKKGVREITTNDTIWLQDHGFLSDSIKPYLQLDPSFQYLLKKYDFETGIFIHVRYNDKFTLNYQRLKEKDPRIYILLTPAYYADALQQFEKGPVYIFSDSTYVKYLLKDVLQEAHFVEEGSYESFFCLTHCRNLVLSDSTFGIAAAYLNQTSGLKIVAPGYTNDGMNKLKIINTPYKYTPTTYIVQDRSYIVPTSLAVYEKIKQLV